MASNPLSLSDSFLIDAGVVHETDKEHDPYVGDFLSKMQTYQMEFDLEKLIGKPPQCFVREFGDVIDPYVILRDPNHNELEVHVVKKKQKIYFDEGWYDLKNIYDIPFGAWVTFTYINPKLLDIRLTTRWGEEVKYPTSNPPHKRLLHKLEFDGIAGSSMECFRPVSFVRTYVKTMTSSDVNSGTLILPWHGFAEGAFPFAFSKLLLVDSQDAHFHCTIGFGVDAFDEYCCKVSNGWIDFCDCYGLSEGDKVRFCINAPIHDYVMYVSVYPQFEF